MGSTKKFFRGQALLLRPVSLNDAQIDDAEVYKAADAAQIRELIHELPDKLETIVGERGGGTELEPGLTKAKQAYSRGCRVLPRQARAMQTAWCIGTTERAFNLSIYRLLIHPVSNQQPSER